MIIFENISLKLTRLEIILWDRTDYKYRISKKIANMVIITKNGNEEAKQYTIKITSERTKRTKNHRIEIHKHPHQLAFMILIESYT